MDTLNETLRDTLYYVILVKATPKTTYGGDQLNRLTIATLYPVETTAIMPPTTLQIEGPTETQDTFTPPSSGKQIMEDITEQEWTPPTAGKGIIIQEPKEQHQGKSSRRSLEEDLAQAELKFLKKMKGESSKSNDN